MSLQANPRRDQRRRLLVSWNRSLPAEQGPEAGAAPPRRSADYAPEAHPEKQPAVAMLLPTRFSRLSLAAFAILLITTGTVGVGAWPPALEYLARLGGERFSRTVAVIREVVDLRWLLLGGWVAEVLLVLAAIVALAIRGMRRHRRDDYQGRYRAWGWMAVLFFVASSAGRVPLDRLIGCLVSDASGVAFGPDGYGWWVALVATVLGTVSLWAILPLHQRLGPGFWLLLGLIAWGGAAACRWGDDGSQYRATAAAMAWVAGAAGVCIAMLTAARGVIREVRGEVTAGTAPARSAKRSAKKAAAPPLPRAAEAEQTIDSSDRDEAFEPVDESHTTAEASAERSDNGGYTDGADDEDAGRPLSKAERKRLRRMARSGQAA